MAAADDAPSARAPEPEDLARLCRALKETHDVLGVSIPVASAATLILTKNTHRHQDAIDRAFLEGLVRRG